MTRSFHLFCEANEYYVFEYLCQQLYKYYILQGLQQKQQSAYPLFGLSAKMQEFFQQPLIAVISLLSFQITELQ